MDGRDWYSCLLAPRRVAVVGATDDLRRPGGRVLAALIRHGFAGQIFPVNPRRSHVQGLPAYPSLAEVPERLDLAVVLVAADATPELMQECADAGAAVVVIGSAGFSETGTDGAELERRLADAATRSGLRLIGPNTNGIVGAAAKLAATFTPVVLQDGVELADGRVSIISQSGAIGATVFDLLQRRSCPVAAMVNTGNELDVTLEEVLHRELGSRPTGHVVLAYVEGLTRGLDLVPAAREAAAHGHTVVLMKVGVTPAGAHAAASHTAKLAGEELVYEGVFRQLGIVRARSLTHVADVARVAVSHGADLGRRATIASMSGGVGIILTDLLETLGLELAQWSDEWRAKLDGILPRHLSRRNPIDVAGGPFFDLDLLERMLHVIDANPESDLSILAFNGFEDRQDEIAERLISTAAGMRDPLVVVWMGRAEEGRRRLDVVGIPTFDEPARAVEAVASLATRRPGSIVTGPSVITGESRSVDPALEARVFGAAGGVLEETAVRELLETYGIPVVPEREVQTAADVLAAVETLGPATVAKLRAPGLIHKTEVGGVRTGLHGEREAVEAVADLQRVAEKSGLLDSEVVLQAQVPAGVELLIGMKADPTFGPVLTIGMGGIATEVLSDVQVRLPWLDEDDVADIVASLRHSRLLRGFRGLPRADESVIGDVVQRFAQLVRDWGAAFSSIDVNPLIVPAGGGAPVVVDAVVTVNAQEVNLCHDR